ncbi:MAG: hypothetical protein V7K68_19575 [Nostoc sp.]|uniref:hypothetical protein n=1 Tax=Nostoc sp. TaxID=1180 RepID=UPI002FF67A15
MKGFLDCDRYFLPLVRFTTIAAVFRGRNPLTVVQELNVLLNDCRLAVDKTF